MKLFKIHRNIFVGGYFFKDPNGIPAIDDEGAILMVHFLGGAGGRVGVG
jgi:hypothetical protein